jgi:hypothetical protein
MMKLQKVLKVNCAKFTRIELCTSTAQIMLLFSVESVLRIFTLRMNVLWLIYMKLKK